MRNFQKVENFLILLILQVSDIHSSAMSNESGSGSQNTESNSVQCKYETKHSAGDMRIPDGLIRTDYDNFKPPPGPRTHDGLVQVLITVTVRSLLDFQEDKAELSMDWFIGFQWKDNRFDAYANVENPDVDANGHVLLDGRVLERIWYPHVHMDSLKSNSQAFLMSAPAWFIVVPKANSSVIYNVLSTIQTTCETDYTFYPFDVVVCRIIIRSVLFNSKLALYAGTFKIYDNVQVAGFQVNVTKFQRSQGQASDLPRVGFKILLKRDPTSSVIQVYIPSLVFIVICFGSFSLTTTSDRIACTTLSLVSLFVLLGSIGSTPQGPYVTYLHKWVLMCILIVFLPLVEMFISLKLKALAQSQMEKLEKKNKKSEAKHEQEVGGADASGVKTTSMAMATESDRKGKLLKTVLLIEQATPVLVLGVFFIYNIYYWNALVKGSQEKFNEQWDKPAC